MNLSDVHPDELIFRHFLTDAEQVLKECEGQYLDDNTKTHLPEGQATGI
jgi:hypothetical protein